MSLDAKQLAALFDAVSGRRGAVADDVAPALRAWAERVLAARRETRRDACPRAVVRRVQSLFRERPVSMKARVMRLVADSWSDAALATRGAATAPRTMRFEMRAAVIDVQVVSDPDGEVRLYVAVESTRADIRLGVLIPPRARARRAALDAHGTTVIDVPAAAREIVLILEDADGEVGRTPRIPLRGS